MRNPRKKSSEGSARVSRAGFGVAPKRTSPIHRACADDHILNKVRDREDALANTRDACATRKPGRFCLFILRALRLRSGQAPSRNRASGSRFGRGDRGLFAPLIHPVVHGFVPKLAVLRLKHPMAFVRKVQHFGRHLQDLQGSEEIEPLRNIDPVIVLAVHDQRRRFEIRRVFVR